MRTQIWQKENLTDRPTDGSTDKPVIGAAFHAFLYFQCKVWIEAAFRGAIATFYASAFDSSSNFLELLFMIFILFMHFFLFVLFNVRSAWRNLLWMLKLLFMLLLSTACPTSWNATFYSKWRSVEICFHWTLFLSTWPILRGRDCIAVLSLSIFSWNWSKNVFFCVSNWLYCATVIALVSYLCSA